ncbi:acyltransferase family protein [Cellvibrio polysaccharolyticus]|uniref:acyltransferase family protein n=1 Tax=Cellvibrio polysaccharolyticus TaxID=2082724 RepID=UPI0019338680|nr:heparan-alpha-glucosaminide N-acetyltransferase domain-containing protein [Cellvibrio polysaccharolyticus]
MVKQRFMALDVMRGLTLLLMILVNTPGSWSYVYAPLLHADWHGATPTDYVFPFFLFMVGAAMVFSGRSLRDLTFTQQFSKIFRRSLLIFLIGLFLNAFPFSVALQELRIPGVLQRIALAYFFAIWIVLYLPLTGRLIAALVLLLGYWLILQLSADPYSLEHSVVRQIDLLLLGENHVWRGKGIAFDPEGILSTLPSIVQVLIGFEITRYLVAAENKNHAQKMLLVAGVAMVAIGLIWHPFFPINKYLWTSSFVLLTSGVAVIVLLALIRLENIAAFRGVLHALTLPGKNPLFIYALSILWAKTMYLIPVGGQSFYQWLFAQLSLVFSPLNASLCFALLNVALMWLVAWWLDRKKIIIAL